MSDLSKFIELERQRFGIEDNNRFATSFSRITRYYEFLSIILERYCVASARFIANTNALIEAPQTGTQAASDEQRLLLNEGSQLNLALHLEIESFYVFAKILLDKVAHSLEFYFGPARSIPFDSHDCLVKNLKAYVGKKKLKLPHGFLERAEMLKTAISDFRDSQIAHEKSPRTITGTGSYPDGRTIIIPSRIYPRKTDNVQPQSKELDDLLEGVNHYLVFVMELLRANQDRTNLTLKVAGEY